MVVHESIELDELITEQPKTEVYTNLEQYQKENTHTDCVVIVHEKEFQCHALVLRIFSPIFAQLEPFVKFQLTDQDKCSPETFTLLYEWMRNDYDHSFLNSKNVLDVLVASRYLGMTILEEDCYNYIDNLQKFNEYTAYWLYKEAVRKNLTEIKELMLPRIKYLFLFLVSSKDWLELDIEDVLKFLKSNYISVNCEMDVFAAAVRWLRHDWNNRWQYRKRLFKCVRFAHMCSWQLLFLKRSRKAGEEYRQICRDPDVFPMLEKGHEYVLLEATKQMSELDSVNQMFQLEEPIERNWTGIDFVHYTYDEFIKYLKQLRLNYEAVKTYRNLKSFILDVKDFLPPNVLREVMTPILPDKSNMKFTRKTEHKLYKTKEERKILKVNQCPPWAREWAACTIQRAYRNYSERKRERLKMVESRKNFLAIRKMFSPSNNDLTNLERYKPSRSILTPDLPPAESLFFPDQEAILVTCSIHQNAADALYRYHPTVNKWELIAALPEPRQQHCIAYLNGKLYVVGGCDTRTHTKALDTVWSFDPKRQSWFSEPSLKNARKCFGLIAWKKCLYAFGGKDRSEKAIDTMEKYCPRRCSWSTKRSMLNPRYAFGYTKYRKYIWVAGGITANDETTDLVEGYDMQVDQWTHLIKLTSARCFLALIVHCDRLYTVGGAGAIIRKQKHSSASENHIQVFDKEVYEWKNQGQLEIPRHSHCVAYFGSQLIILGGFTTVYMKSLCNVECFCTERKRNVQGITSLPYPSSSFASITLPPYKSFYDEDSTN